MWDRPNTEFMQSQDLAWTPVPDGEFGSGGGLRRVLSADPVAGALSMLVRLRVPQRGALTGGGDLYVLEGAGRVNGRDYRPGHFLTLAEGGFIDLCPVGVATTVFLGTFGPPELSAQSPGAPGQTPIVHLDVEELPWSSPGWHDEAAVPDGAVKWLRRDRRGIVFLSTKLPGWRSDREERHPHVEESLRLSGDFFAGPPGVMTAGSYFFHRPGFWHGPLYSRTGTTSLIRADAEISTEYRDPQPLVDRDRAYLPLPHPALS